MACPRWSAQRNSLYTPRNNHTRTNAARDHAPRLTTNGTRATSSRALPAASLGRLEGGRLGVEVARLRVGVRRVAADEAAEGRRNKGGVSERIPARKNTIKKTAHRSSSLAFSVRWSASWSWWSPPVTDQNFQTAPPARPKPTTNLKARSVKALCLGAWGQYVIVELRAREGERGGCDRRRPTGGTFNRVAAPGGRDSPWKKLAAMKNIFGATELPRERRAD